MGDSMWLQGADMAALVELVGQAVGLGVGLSVCFFILGWGFAFVIDLFRGL